MKIDEIDISKIEMTDWVDPRIPAWYTDRRVWDYLGRRYGIRPGGIIDDSDDKPPILIIERCRAAHLDKDNNYI